MTHTASSRSNRLLKMMCHTVLATRNVSEGILTAQQPSASSIDCPKDLRTTKGMPTDTKKHISMFTIHIYTFMALFGRNVNMKTGSFYQSPFPLGLELKILIIILINFLLFTCHNE